MEDFKKILSRPDGSGRLMVIFPHPDDETMASGGLLLAAKQRGWETIAVTLTKGGAGKIFGHVDGLIVAEVREKELKKAAKILRIDRLVIANFPDGRLREQKEILKKWLTVAIKKYRPDLVVSYDHSGLTGHPDHIVSSLAVKEVITREKGEKRPLLFWVTLAEELRRLPAFQLARDFFSRPTHRLDLGWNWLRKWRAARAHKSQRLGKNLPWSLSYFLFKYPYEWYHRVDLNKNYPYKFVDFPL